MTHLLNRIYVVTLLLFLLTTLTGCGSGSNESEREIIKVGAILPLTGSLSVMGEVERNAMILATENINKDGKKIEVIFEDGKGNASDAVSAANKLINIDDVDVLISSTTGASLAVEPIASRNEKNLIAFCMDPDVANKSTYSIRYYLGIEQEAEAIVNYFDKNRTDVEKAGILYAKVPSLEKAALDIYELNLEEFGIEVPFVESYQIGETSFRTAVQKMKNMDIDHLIIIGYGFEYPNVFSELENQQFLEDVQILGGWGFLYTDVPSNLLEGVLVSGPEYVFQARQLAGDFSQEYREQYGSYPNFDAAFAYNVIMSLSSNFTKEDLQSPIKEELINSGDLSGVVGNYHFDSTGNMIVPTGLGIFDDGRIIAYDSPQN